MTAPVVYGTEDGPHINRSRWVRRLQEVEAVQSHPLSRLRVTRLVGERDRSRADSEADLAWFSDYDDFYKARASSLVRLATFHLLDEQAAEDAVAEVLVKVEGKWKRIRAMDAPDAYVRRMVLNQCISHQRRSFLRHERLTNPVDIPERSSLDTSEAVAARDEMWRLLQKLTDQQRAVLVLRYYEDLSDEQIANILDIKPVTVRVHALHARTFLRARLGTGDAP